MALDLRQALKIGGYVVGQRLRGNKRYPLVLMGGVPGVAPSQQLEALPELPARSRDRLPDPASAAGSDLELRAAARRVDVAYQALVATVRPMRTPLFGSLAERIAGFMATAVAARHYASNLLLDASTRDAGLDAQASDGLAVARRQ